MANHGNTGQRYKIQTITSAVIEDDVYIRTTLACGHSTLANWETPESAQRVLEWTQDEVKYRKRTRCTECKVQ